MDFNDLKVNFGVFHVLNPFMILLKQSEVVFPVENSHHKQPGNIDDEV